MQWGRYKDCLSNVVNIQKDEMCKCICTYSTSNSKSSWRISLCDTEKYLIGQDDQVVIMVTYKIAKQKSVCWAIGRFVVLKNKNPYNWPNSPDKLRSKMGLPQSCIICHHQRSVVLSWASESDSSRACAVPSWLMSHIFALLHVTKTSLQKNDLCSVLLVIEKKQNLFFTLQQVWMMTMKKKTWLMTQKTTWWTTLTATTLTQICQTRRTDHPRARLWPRWAAWSSSPLQSPMGKLRNQRQQVWKGGITGSSCLHCFSPSALITLPS